MVGILAMLSQTWSWPLADKHTRRAGQPQGTGTLVSCRANRQGSKELREQAPRREQPVLRLSASPLTYSLALRVLYVCVGSCVYHGA